MNVLSIQCVIVFTYLCVKEINGTTENESLTRGEGLLSKSGNVVTYENGSLPQTQNEPRETNYRQNNDPPQQDDSPEDLQFEGNENAAVQISESTPRQQPFTPNYSPVRELQDSLPQATTFTTATALSNNSTVNGSLQSRSLTIDRPARRDRVTVNRKKEQVSVSDNRRDGQFVEVTEEEDSDGDDGNYDEDVEEYVEYRGTADDWFTTRDGKFTLGLTGATWRQARRRCDKKGKRFASIRNIDDEEELESTILKAGRKNSRFWLGAMYSRGSAGFSWSTGDRPLTYKKWSSGYPRLMHKWRCVFSQQLVWWNWPCSSLNYFVCQDN